MQRLLVHREKKKTQPYWQLKRQPLWGPIIPFCAVPEAAGCCQPPGAAPLGFPPSERAGAPTGVVLHVRAAVNDTIK